VREIEENVKVRQIIIPLPHFDILFSLAEATPREKKPNKNLPIKVIVTTQLFEEKQQSIIIHKKTTKPIKNFTGRGLVRGGSILSLLSLCARFFAQDGILVREL
jgi:hypothetical protein